MKIKHRILGEIEMSIEEFAAYERSLTTPNVSETLNFPVVDAPEKKRKSTRGFSSNKFTQSEIDYFMDNLDKGARFLIKSALLRSRHSEGSIRTMHSRIKHGHMNWIGTRTQKLIKAYYKNKAQENLSTPNIYTEDVTKEGGSLGRKDGDYDRDTSNDYKTSPLPKSPTVWGANLKNGL